PPPSGSTPRRRRRRRRGGRSARPSGGSWGPTGRDPRSTAARSGCPHCSSSPVRNTVQPEDRTGRKGGVAMAEHYASGNWHVQEGKEDEFITRWTQFLEWTREDHPALESARLIRDAGDLRHFI